MKIFLSILLTAILTNNYILSKFLGICPFLGVSKKLNTAVGMSAAVIFVMVLATAVTYPLNTFLENNNLGYLQTIVFILVIAALVQLVEIVLRKYIPALYNSLGIYLPLITTNCAVLGVTILNIDSGYTFLESMVNSFGASFEATAAAAPPELPPGTFSTSHGLRVTPEAEVSVVLPIANSSILSLPITTMPSSLRRLITVALYVGIKFSRIFDEQVVRISFVQILSFTPIGTPASLPVYFPLSIPC